MRCEICNRSMTETYFDGEGQEHEYCLYCIDEINLALDGYDGEDEDSWFLFDPYEYDDEDEEGEIDETAEEAAP